MTENRFGAGNGNAASQIRGLFIGGGNPDVFTTIDYVEIASLGNGQEFGNLTIGLDGTQAINNSSVISDCHGGLGGY